MTILRWDSETVMDAARIAFRDRVHQEMREFRDELQRKFEDELRKCLIKTLDEVSIALHKELDGTVVVNVHLGDPK